MKPPGFYSWLTSGGTDADGYTKVSAKSADRRIWISLVANL